MSEGEEGVMGNAQASLGYYTNENTKTKIRGPGVNLGFKAMRGGNNRGAIVDAEANVIKAQGKHWGGNVGASAKTGYFDAHGRKEAAIAGFGGMWGKRKGVMTPLGSIYHEDYTDDELYDESDQDFDNDLENDME
ncbi:hypothetical protein HDV03_004348 [Kappamyces sp. JEL0829]|nr:hypothetical protein HDV03_004348 [Kappamyces sp. JEL0829]